MTNSALGRVVSSVPPHPRRLAGALLPSGPVGSPPRPARVLAFASRYEWLALRRRRAQIAARHALGLR